jgi:hypothetical protein
MRCMVEWSSSTNRRVRGRAECCSLDSAAASLTDPYWFATPPSCRMSSGDRVGCGRLARPPYADRDRAAIRQVTQLLSSFEHSAAQLQNGQVAQ